jgi:ADP-dependent NAD(P)H-hydrate dehydratase / NAD(P)H-hydrate epimerase
METDPTFADAPAPWAIGAGHAAPAAGWTLLSVAATRRLETHAAVDRPPHALMRRAGLATARLALAVRPQARRIWVAAGPGNNGGDGLEAALHLHRSGKDVTVSLLSASDLPPDAAAALARAREGGVRIVSNGLSPSRWGFDDLAIDALLGIGTTRAPVGGLLSAIEALNASLAPVLAVDVPSGLNADRGTRFESAPAVRARWTLSLLSLKPGLFTAEGRDHAGPVWFDDLGIASRDAEPAARLLTDVDALWPQRNHAQHKGSFGDLWVVGGAAGMAGAVLLAASAGLVAGAGRVFIVPLDPSLPSCTVGWPELMHRATDVLRNGDTPLEQATVVVGCGGGDSIREILPMLLARAGRLVLDADALNAVASDPALQRQLAQRSARGRDIVLTPHPLEAARLLGCAASDVQADRIKAASALARLHRATVVLKGSGTVIATIDGPPWLNATGNAALASAGTGDVLAGWLGGLWAQGLEVSAAARLAVFSHGVAADQWAAGATHAAPFAAHRLVKALSRASRR